MLRLISPFAAAAAIGGALLLPNVAPAIVSDPAYGCAPVFDLVFTYANGAVDPSDHNGDGWSCRKSLPNGRYVLIDNTIFGGTTAQGVTDTGSAVLVDPTTGEVVGG